MKGKNEGIHGVLVRCRGDALEPVEGVTVEDMGHKMGLNGVDNAKLTFDNVRVPRVNLLNKFSDITPEGEFVTTIKQVKLGKYIMRDNCIVYSLLKLSLSKFTTNVII